jgi:probable phosphoglycerate mutase
VSLADATVATAPRTTCVGPPFFFIRHGETDWNREGCLQGQRDIPLNGRGRDQAMASGRILRRLLAAKRRDAAVLDFVASPLGRARQTMELMRQAMGLPPHAYRVDDRLTEIGFGAWEGMTWTEVAARDPAGYRARKRDKWHWTPPDGESYAAVAERVRPWLGTVADDSVVVAHGGVARAILTLVTDLDPRGAPAIEISQGRVLALADGRAEWA